MGVEKAMCCIRKLLPVLTSSQEAHVDIEAIADGVDYNTKLTRARMEMVTSTVMNKIIGIPMELIKEAELDPSSFSHVLHLGGGLAIPRLKTKLKQYFPYGAHHDG